MTGSQHAGRPLAVVTGASSGIGLELARQFCAHDFDVVGIAEDAAIDDLPAVLEDSGARVTPVRADLRVFADVQRAWMAVQALHQPVDALALNAGVGVGGPFVDTALDADLGLIRLNIDSLVHLAKLALPEMVRRGAGRILITSSIAATMPGPYYATYAASKSFALSFAEAIRYELKDSGVTVTALMPGPTDTHFFERAGIEDTRVGTSPKDDAQTVARDGFEALMRGDDLVVAGSMKNKAQALGAKVMPEKAKAAMHARQVEPGSG
jgi:short-subunit dehydrogenase